MNLIIPEWSAPKNVRAFSTVRHGGVSESPYQGDDTGKNGLNFGMHVGDSPLAVKKTGRFYGKNYPLSLSGSIRFTGLR